MGEDWASRNNGLFGGRGMCGLAFLYKVWFEKITNSLIIIFNIKKIKTQIGGHLAENGESLNNIKRILFNIKENISTLGVSLQPCSLPGL